MDYTQDLRKVGVPMLVIHGDDDQIVPIGHAGELTAQIVPDAQLKVMKARRMGLPRHIRTRSTPTFWPLRRAERANRIGMHRWSVEKGC